MIQPFRRKLIALVLLLVMLTSAVLTACGDDSPGKTPSTPVQELFSLIPDSPDTLTRLVFNDYAALRSLHNLPAITTFAELSKQADLKARFMEIFSPLNFSQLSGGTNIAIQPLPSLVGYDFFQIAQDAEAGGATKKTISVAKGEFDYASIDKAFTTASATKGKIGAYNSYSFDKLDFNNQIQLTFFMYYDNLVVAPDKKLLLSSPDSATVKASGALLNSPNTTTSVKDNPGVKAMLENFGNPKSILISNQFISRQQLYSANPRLTPEILKTLEDEIKKTPLPVPLLGGYSYIEDKLGEDFYVLANYYSDAESAKQALPVMEKLLKEGTSNIYRRPYSEYFQVLSAETKGQLTLYKVKALDRKAVISIFTANRDLPLFYY